MQYSKESLDRIKKIESLKKSWVVCYANNFKGKQNIEEITSPLIPLLQREKSLKDFSSVKDSSTLMENWANWEFRTAWRLMSSRAMWKLLFWKLRDNTWDIQICFMKDKILFNTGKDSKKVEKITIDWEEKSSFKIAEKFCQVWDYIWVTWDLFLTKHWEITIFVKEFQILSKAIRPLPEKFHGIVDKEAIYRQRYLDLIMSEQSYDRFKFRSRFFKNY